MSKDCLNQIENIWKVKTTAANELFNKEIFEDALCGYKEALGQAELLNNNPEECISAGVPFIQVYVISCNNMANTFIELRQKDQAENMLKRAIYYLLHLSEKVILKTEEIQRELKRSVMEYVNFVEKSGGETQNEEALFREIKEQLKENKLILGH